MKLHRFNEEGIKEFADFLDALEVNPGIPIPNQLLTNPALALPVSASEEIQNITFKNRLDFAQHLDRILSTVTGCDVEADVGLWSWITLLYFDQVCPAESNGFRKIRERARYIPAVSNFRKYYRHLLAGPYRVYRAHRNAPETALILLCGPLHRPGDIVEQIVARQEIITNPNAVALATKIYYDTETGSFRRGAASKGKGSARRLADVMNQFDVTWDLYWMTSENLLQKLPDEFENFRSKTRS